jgi:hypothetical protein
MFNIVGKIQSMGGLAEADAQLVVFALSRPKERAEIHLQAKSFRITNLERS